MGRAEVEVVDGRMKAFRLVSERERLLSRKFLTPVQFARK